MPRLWRRELLARSAALTEALELAREAARLADTTDASNQRARVLLDLAEVLSLAGAKTEAAVRVREALELFEQKGNTVEAEMARVLARSPRFEPERAEAPRAGGVAPAGAVSGVAAAASASTSDTATRRSA